jgi:hypothetical protein
MLGEVLRSCLRSEFMRGVAAERYRLAQVVYGQCPLVERPSRWWLFHRYHLNLAFTITVVAFTRPRCHRLRWSRSSLKIPRSARSIAHANVEEARWVRGHNSSRSGRAVCGAAGWSFSAADALAALEEGVANKWRSCDRATRGYSRQLRPARRSSFQATVTTSPWQVVGCERT